MFKIKIKEDERVILRARFDDITKAEDIIKDLKKKYNGGRI